MTFQGYVGLQRRGLIASPSEPCRRMHLDEPGAKVEILERDDGVVELRAALPLPADQAWLRTEQWQRPEREVDEHVARGEVAVHESTDDFLTPWTSSTPRLGSREVEPPLESDTAFHGASPSTTRQVQRPARPAELTNTPQRQAGRQPPRRRPQHRRGTDSLAVDTRDRLEIVPGEHRLSVPGRF